MANAFSDVDASADAELLALYLDWMAGVLRALKVHLIDLLGVCPGDRVLDIGCGTGHDLIELATRQAAPVGIDTSARMLEQSRRHIRERPCGDLPLIQADGEALPFPSGCFDGVRIERVLQHAKDPARISEAHRVLRPSARLVAFEPDWSSLAIDSDHPELSDAVVRGAMLGVRQPRIGLELRSSLVRAGFHDVVCEPGIGNATSLERLNWAFNSDRALGRAVDAGLLTREQGAGWRREMQRRSEDGRFWATLPRVVVTACP